MRASLFLRSFFNQALINYRGMTHLGILWALLPTLRKRDTGRRARMLRAFGFFNSHPYLAGYIIGATVRMEEDEQGELLERLKRASVAPLGAVGDRLFWYYLKPLSGVLACLGLILWLEGFVTAALLCIGVGILGYNILHLWIRWRGLVRGLELGSRIHLDIQQLTRHPLNLWMGRFFALFSGIFLGTSFMEVQLSGHSWAQILGLGAVTIISWQLPERGWALPLFLGGLALLALLSANLGVTAHG
ncbi:MAG: PTS system mannose/fructose/sorbose family transporter subunit IID [Calditrichaeota bacterium]|nr:PTS system mannose/fructose/sorbose family transporter subunit IID [Candidatus Cloacimonadota bacterium]MCB1045931.1 PTS system mannose/fructose/sorbose family transporter subunit IID [Calditrichota bacterium]